MWTYAALAGGSGLIGYLIGVTFALARLPRQPARTPAPAALVTPPQQRPPAPSFSPRRRARPRANTRPEAWHLPPDAASVTLPHNRYSGYNRYRGVS